MLGPGGDHISGLDGDDGTVGVSNESSEASVDGDDTVVVGVRVASGVGVGSGSVGVGTEGVVDGTASGSVGNLGSVHLRGVNGDNGTVGVSNQASEVRVASSVAEGVDGVDSASSSCVSNLGSVHLGGVSGHDGTVGVSHKLGGGESHAGRENLRKYFVMSKSFRENLMRLVIWSKIIEALTL